MRPFMFLLLLGILSAVAMPAAAQTYTVGDTITVIQRPLINIPSIVRPGDMLTVSCDADPQTTSWTAALERDGLVVPLSIGTAVYSPSTLWWTLSITTPDVPVFDLYDLHVTADFGLDDVTNHSVKVVPEFRSQFEVVHITDTHIPTYLYYYQSGADTDSTTSMALRAITEDINIINPEFVLLTGDFMNEGELEDYLDKKYYSRSMMHLNEFEMPIYVTAGNHDIGGWNDTPPSDGKARRDWWKFYGWKRLDNPPPGAPAYTQDYSFDYRDIHFVGLEAYDNYDSWRFSIYGAESFTNMQMSWLQADIAAASGSSRVVLFHHNDFQNELDLSGLGVDLALYGHAHSDIEDSSYPMNVRTDNAGGTNRPFRVVKFDGSAISARPTLSAQNPTTLEVVYAPGNDGSVPEVTAQVFNGHPVSFPHGLLRVSMPGGARGYTASGGVLTQVNDTGDHAVCYVEVNIPANGYVFVTVNADTSTATSTPVTPATRLLGAAPNPFNPRTEIAFELATAGHCRVTVFDVRGHELDVLIDEQRSTGRHTIAWNGCDAAGRAQPSGTYFVGLRAGSYVETRKVVLAR